MMRSTPATRIGKPPPPVPPRPSKTLVAEALAKTRHDLTAPVRTAPPPPINKSKSTVSVNVVRAAKPPNFERSISEEVKTSSRTVIFQSSKMNEKINKVKERKKSDECVKRDIKTEEVKDILTSDKNEENNLDTDEDTDQLLNDRNHVNTLIDEMFASVLEVNDEENDENSSTVVVVDDRDTSLLDKKKNVQFDDRKNHELLISELESMRMEEDEKISKRQRKPSRDSSDSVDDVSKIQHSDWVEVNDGQEVRLSSCQITIEAPGNKLKLDYER